MISAISLMGQLKNLVDNPTYKRKLNDLGLLKLVHEINKFLMNLDEEKKKFPPNRDLLNIRRDIRAFERIAHNINSAHIIKSQIQKASPPFIQFCEKNSINPHIFRVIKNWQIQDSNMARLINYRPPIADKLPNIVYNKVHEPYREVDAFLSRFIDHGISLLTEHYKIAKQDVYQAYLSLLPVYIIRMWDHWFLYQGTARQREMFGKSFITKISGIMIKPEVKRVLDLFSNSGIIGIIGKILRKEYVLLNDLAFTDSESVFFWYINKFQKIQFEYSRAFSGNRLSELPFNEVEELNQVVFKTTEYLTLLEEYYRKIESGQKFVPLDLNDVNFKEALSSLGDHFNEKIALSPTIVEEKKIKITENTTSNDFGLTNFDMVILDPPFGVASAEHGITSEQGLNLLNYCITLAENQLHAKKYLLIRANPEWQINFNPLMWDVHEKLKVRRNSQTIILKKK